MVPLPGTPRRSGAGRPRKSTTRTGSADTPKIDKAVIVGGSEPPYKKRRYVPGGPGGGGRYVDEDGTEIPVGGTGPGGYNYTGPRGRVGRENAAAGITPVVYPRRDRSTRTRTILPRSRQQQPRFTSAAQAAAMVQSDGYKPREERGWEEFHPSLDIDAKLMVFSAAEVDGIPKSRPVTPAGPQSASGSFNDIHTPNGGTTKNESVEGQTPTGSMNGDTTKTNSVPGTPPIKRRPGRPPRDPIAFYAAQNAANSGESPKTSVLHPSQNQNPKERLTLLQPIYRKVDTISRFEDKSSGLVRYVEKSMANVGYQESDIFIRPEHTLIKATDRHLEDESDLVEYDMDEIDDKWLEALNERRKASDAEPITREMFEITITKIEKEWHIFERKIPKPNPKPPQTHRPRSSSAAAVNGEPMGGEEQDSKCAICDDGDCENTNAIVFCDGCDLAVHQECYGVPFIPEGQWHCRKCQNIGGGIPTCMFCPNIEGAFKLAEGGKWSHMLCAMWIPEVTLGNRAFMEPIQDVDKVPKTRWKLNCYICQQKMGACIQCGNKACYQAFHVTCARRARLFLKMKNSHGQLIEHDDTATLKAFCDKHCPPDYAKENDVARATREAKHWYRKKMKHHIWADNQAAARAIAAQHNNAAADHTSDESAAVSATLGDAKKKANSPPKNLWKLPAGAPIIPAIVFDAIESSLQRFTIRKRKDFVAEVCRYWTLKRESRRGAPLIKRFQLQNETFSSMEIARRNFSAMGPSGLPRLTRRRDFAAIMAADMERLKIEAHLVVKREEAKLQVAFLEQDMVNTVYFPVWKLLPPIIDKALALDIKNVFTEGLKKIQASLDVRHYVLATTLTQDLCSVLSIGIEDGPQVKVEDIVNKEHVSPSKHAASDIRERRKLAKRIIKAIQSQLVEAVRSEADVTKQPADQMIQGLEKLLEACLHTRQEPAIGSAVGSSFGNAGSRVLSGSSEVPAHSAAMDTDLHDEDAPGEEVDDAGIFPSVSCATDTVSGMNFDSDVNRDAGRSMRQFTGNGPKSSDTPPDTNGFNPTLNFNQPPPPTPPVSNGGANSASGLESSAGDPATSLTEGGIPWYLKSFDPVGTTIREVQWTGRDVVRGMSEELSEIDDDELKGMGEAMEGIEDDAEDVADGNKTEAVAKTKKAKAKKRWRGFR